MFLKYESQADGMHYPQQGEVVLAARSLSGPYTQAVVTRVRERYHNRVRINWVWLENSGPTMTTDGYRAGERGNITVPRGGCPAFVRRIEGTPPPLKLGDGDA